MSDFIGEGGPMVENPASAAEFFARVFVQISAPLGPNGLDLDPINLYTNMRDDG